MNNEELVAEFQAGNQGVFQLLLKKNRGLMMQYARYAASYFKDELEDVTQVCELALFKAAKDFDASLGFTFTTIAVTYIKRDAYAWRRQNMRHLRRLNRVPLYLDYLPNPIQTPLEITEFSQYVQNIQERMQRQLDPRWREIVERHHKGESFAEIARDHNITRERARQLYEKALHRVRRACR